MSNSGVLVCESDTDFEKIVEIFKKEIKNARYNSLFLQPLENYVDVGAHYGAFAHEAHRRGAQTIYCFEASSTNSLLMQNLLDECGVDNYRIFNLAVAGESGEIVKLRKINNAGSDQYSIINYDHRSEYQISEEFEPCLTVSLEDIFKLCNLEKISTMKVDIEGAEYDFLMNKDLSNIDSMYIEFHCGPKKNKDLCIYLSQYFYILGAYTASDDKTHMSPIATGDGDTFINIGEIDFDMELHYMMLTNKNLKDLKFVKNKNN